MDERQEKSILEMGRGAIMERADYEMRAMIRNILDPNTSAKAARKLNITLTFKPGDDRQTIVVECVAKSMKEFVCKCALSIGVATRPEEYVYGATILQVDDEVLLMRSSDGQTYYLLERMVELP